MPATLRGAAGFRLPALLLTMLCALLAVPAAASAGQISGVAYQDLDRNAARAADEPVLSGQQILLVDPATTQQVSSTVTDSAGRYAFANLADGDYRVMYESGSWWALRDDWVPTTTGSIRPARDVRLSGSATVDFGWRRIVRSTSVYSPMATYVAPDGLRVEAFNDAIDPRAVSDALHAGWVGAEAPTVVVRVGYGDSDMTSAGAQQANGVYSNYRAVSYSSWASWLDGEATLVHEYGHAWSLYHAYITQQDLTLRSYLRARGLEGDPRVNSAYGWHVEELIAEDYRQLFGSPNARLRPQANPDIPPASSVSGLREFLQSTFTTAPSEPEPAPAPAPTLDVTGLAMNPAPVKTTGTLSFTLSAPAKVTARIVSSKGATVRTLVSSADRGAGAQSLVWDKTSDAGRTVGRGTYTARVEATANGTTVTRSVSFSVS